ncbi:MAG: COX15/CtaA family protein [Pseudomonadales bacterium]|nr:COX15/CtaA family protein [Pseudomonadales bacterium]MCP5171027.1 COX15/CtaA family protein [Pseudomonadales bacterium]MCP5301735.1 COX15/CtaA family protein [Pseudomonadales bacterium]
MQKNSSDNPQKTLAKITLAVLVATVLINLLSAYIRHTESGLGCQPWPDCYAVIGQYVAAEKPGDIAQKALAPAMVAKQIHRTVATLLVIGVLLLIHQSRKPMAMKNANQSLPYLLLGVIVLLSIVGPASYLKTLPVIAVINLLGGLALTGISWWLYLQLSQQICSENTPLQIAKWQPLLWQLAGLLLILQIALGAWLSANFAASACNALFSCQATGDYLNTGSGSFWYFRELQLDKTGRVMFDASSLEIHQMHRWSAVLTGMTLLLAAGSLLRHLPHLSTLVAGLVLTQWLLGVLIIVFKIPMTLVMVHNLNAALLLLSVMSVNFRLISIKNV